MHAAPRRPPHSDESLLNYWLFPDDLKLNSLYSGYEKDCVILFHTSHLVMEKCKACWEAPVWCVGCSFGPLEGGWWSPIWWETSPTEHNDMQIRRWRNIYADCTCWSKSTLHPFSIGCLFGCHFGCVDFATLQMKDTDWVVCAWFDSEV